MVSTTEEVGSTSTLTGLRRIERESTVMDVGMVAEKNSVCLSLGRSGSSRLISWIKPMSSILSASSSTKWRIACRLI